MNKENLHLARILIKDQKVEMFIAFTKEISGTDFSFLHMLKRIFDRGKIFVNEMMAKGVCLTNEK